MTGWTNRSSHPAMTPGMLPSPSCCRARAQVGGAPLLGAAKPVIKAHGSSKAKGIKNAIRQARLCVENDLCGTMQTALDATLAAAAEAPQAE